MAPATLFITLLFVSCIAAAFLPPHPTLHRVTEREIGSVREWDIVGDTHPLQQVDFKVLLKQRNLDLLEKTFWEVSDPKGPKYGQYLNKQEVDGMIAPHPESKAKVVDWLVSNGIPRSSMVVHSDYVTITHHIGGVSNLLSTSFAVFKSSLTGETRVRTSSSIHVPKDLSEHVDFVVGLSEFFEDKARSFSAMRNNARAANATRTPSKSRDASATTDPNVTPQILQKYYGITTTTATNAASTLGITGFTDYYSAGALAQFQTTFGLPKSTVTLVGSPCTATSCQQTESDLDVQYSTALAPGVKTSFFSHSGSQWLLDWAQQLTALTTPPLINSASYGWSEKEQCEIANCQSLGYTPQTYVTRTDTEFKSLGTRGITILVSSGDDGAPSYYNGMGACPADATKYCLAGGCSTATVPATACANLAMTLSGATCYFPMGGNADAGGCRAVYASSSFTAARTAFVNANPTCGIAFTQDAAGNPQLANTCTCAALKAAASGGLNIAAYNYQPTLTTFESMYPASSPYVTSVGATQFQPTSAAPTAEMVASYETGALITSGGGFSAYNAMPSYQQSHVQTYLSSGTNVPPSGSFPSTNRAYPDIAFNGHNYVVVSATGTTAATYNACPCSTIQVDGTSCSSPGLAGMLANINDALMNSGAPPMGFINPLLYQMHTDNPAAFTDIATGTNNCNRAYCCKYGYAAGKGYDPASGLGTPVYSQMSAYFLNNKGAPAAGGDSSKASFVAVAAAVPVLLVALVAAMF